MPEDSSKWLERIKSQKVKTVITDGLRAYEDAFRKEFFTLKKPRTKHEKDRLDSTEQFRKN